MTPLDALRSENQKLRRHLEDLQDDYAALRREAGLEADADTLVRLQLGLQITPRQSRIIAALYAAKGRCVALGALMEAMAGDSELIDNNLRVHVCKVRQKTGVEDICETVWGRGYRMGPQGQALCAKALAGERPEITPRPVRAPNQRMFTPEQEAEIRLEATHSRVVEVARKWGCSENHIYKLRGAYR